MPLYRGAGGAVFEIDNPPAAQLEAGVLVPVEPEPEPPVKKTAAKKAAAPKPDVAEEV